MSQLQDVFVEKLTMRGQSRTVSPNFILIGHVQPLNLAVQK